MSVPKHSLSEANRAMVELIVWGKVPSTIEAFLQTRKTKMKRADATRSASKIWRSDPCQLYAEELRQKLIAQAQRKVAGQQEQVRRRLWREATPIGDIVEELQGDGVKPILGMGLKASDRIVALTRLGQQSAMFKDALVVEKPKKTGAELDDAIMGRLFPKESGAGTASIKKDAGSSASIKSSGEPAAPSTDGVGAERDDVLEDLDALLAGDGGRSGGTLH